MKKHLNIMIMLAVLLILTGCGSVDKSNNNKSSESNLTDCKKGCDMLTNDTIKTQDCYKLCETSKKLESNDISDCDNIEKSSNNFVTKDVCIQDKAIQSRNPEYCGMLSEEMTKDTCYMGLASEMKDKRICNNIKNETIKGICQTEDQETAEE